MPDTNVCTPMTVGEYLAAQEAAERCRDLDIVNRCEALPPGPIGRDEVLDIRYVCGLLRQAWLDAAEEREYREHVDATLKCVLEEHRRHA